MSYVFNSIHRNTLIEDLETVLNQNELHFIHILLDEKTAVKCGNYKGWFLHNDTGAPQSDCASTSEFTFYLAKSLETTIATETPYIEEHNTIQSHYSITLKNYQIDINQ